MSTIQSLQLAVVRAKAAKVAFDIYEAATKLSDLTGEDAEAIVQSAFVQAQRCTQTPLALINSWYASAVRQQSYWE